MPQFVVTTEKISHCVKNKLSRTRNDVCVTLLLTVVTLIHIST